MLTAIVLVLAQALAVQASLFSHTREGDDLEALCAGKPVDLTGVQQLGKLRRLAEGEGGSIDGRKCSRAVIGAIEDLDQLIKLTEGDMCASESIDRLQAFYTRHLDTSSPEGKGRERLPKSLRHFALAYGMQMSNVCKRQMVEEFKGRGRELLDNQRFKLLAALSNERSPIGKLLEGLTGPDEILLPGDLAPYLKKKGAESTTDDKLYLQVGTAPLVRQLQATCRDYFKPMYEPLMRPLIKLANMGFNYKDEPLRCDMECSATARQLDQWSRLVFVCESFGNIHVVEDPSEGSTEGKMVRILTREEAAAIEGSDKLTEPTSGFEVTLRNKPVALPSDLVYDRADERLKKAIKAFKTSRSETDRIKRRMSSKGLRVLRGQVRRGHLGLVVSTGYKTLLARMRGGETIKPTDELVKVLDQVLEQENSAQLDGAVALDPDYVELYLKDIGAIIGFSLIAILIIAAVAGSIFALVMAAHAIG